MASDLSQTIQAALQQGKTREEIYASQLKKGTTIDQIQAALAEIDAETSKDDTQKRTIYLVVLGGAVLVGVGIFSFVASNWTYLSRDAKVILIILAMLATYALGWWVGEVKGYQKTGNALTFLGSLIYGAGIFLIGQIFHISAHWPDGFVLWMLGAIALGWAVESYLVFVLALIVGSISTMGYPFIILDTLFAGEAQSFTSTILMLIATLTTFGVAWMIRKKLNINPEDGY